MSDNERKFRHMWQWIAVETRNKERFVDKYDYFIALNIPKSERPRCQCYACEESMQRARDNGRNSSSKECGYCPIDWGKCDCTEDGTLYDEWEHAPSYEDAAEFAERISQMEWRNTNERAD